MKFITTSWDDGHYLDFRIAELLDKYNIQGTFYVPRANREHAVMDEHSIVALSNHFEIGGHTLNHIRLYPRLRTIHLAEVEGSYKWLYDLLQKRPVSFCFPGGIYDSKVVKCAKDAGFQLLRTNELLSVSNSSRRGVIGTSLQMYEHKKFTYIKHLLKRGRIGNLTQWLHGGASSEILKLVDYYLYKIDITGEGCFHLWGHSWEIDAFHLWNKLEILFKHIASHRDFQFVTNQDLVQSIEIN